MRMVIALTAIAICTAGALAAPSPAPPHGSAAITTLVAANRTACCQKPFRTMMAWCRKSHWPNGNPVDRASCERINKERLRACIANGAYVTETFGSTSCN